MCFLLSSQGAVFFFGVIIAIQRVRANNRLEDLQALLQQVRRWQPCFLGGARFYEADLSKTLREPGPGRCLVCWDHKKSIAGSIHPKEGS